MCFNSYLKSIFNSCKIFFIGCHCVLPRKTWHTAHRPTCCKAFTQYFPNLSNGLHLKICYPQTARCLCQSHFFVPMEVCGVDVIKHTNAKEVKAKRSSRFFLLLIIIPAHACTDNLVLKHTQPQNLPGTWQATLFLWQSHTQWKGWCLWKWMTH